MPRIPAHTMDSAPEQTRETLRALERKFGKLLTIYGGMAQAPVTLAAHAAMESAIDEHGTLDAKTRQAIALSVAAVNHCTYCQAAHTLAGRNAGFTEDQTIAIRRGQAAFDPKLEALLAIVQDIADRVGDVPEATWDTALAAGWTDTELTETFAHVAANLYTTYFTHFAGTGLDLPQAPPVDN